MAEAIFLDRTGAAGRKHQFHASFATPLAGGGAPSHEKGTQLGRGLEAFSIERLEIDIGLANKPELARNSQTSMIQAWDQRRQLAPLEIPRERRRRRVRPPRFPL